MKSAVLVTGGAGFIGSHLVDALLDQGLHVRILDNFLTGSRANLRRFRDDIELIEGDVRDLETCYRACRGVETVFHQAALPPVPRSIADPLALHAVDADATLQMLLAARDEGVCRFVFASSASVYGDTVVSPRHEGRMPCPLSPYAISKLTGEDYCRVFHALYGLETVVLRYFHVFGPRQTPYGPHSAVIPRFVAAALNGEPATLYGDGAQSRDFTYVANVVQANLLAAWIPGVAGGVFNAACGSAHTLLAQSRGIEHATGRALRLEYAAPRDGDVRHSVADITAARERLRYEPAIDFQEGLARTVRWAMKERHAGVRMSCAAALAVR